MGSLAPLCRLTHPVFQPPSDIYLSASHFTYRGNWDSLSLNVSVYWSSTKNENVSNETMYIFVLLNCKILLYNILGLKLDLSIFHISRCLLQKSAKKIIIINVRSATASGLIASGSKIKMHLMIPLFRTEVKDFQFPADFYWHSW